MSPVRHKNERKQCLPIERSHIRSKMGPHIETVGSLKKQLALEKTKSARLFHELLSERGRRQIAEWSNMTF